MAALRRDRGARDAGNGIGARAGRGRSPAAGTDWAGVSAEVFWGSGAVGIGGAGARVHASDTSGSATLQETARQVRGIARGTGGHGGVYQAYGTFHRTRGVHGGRSEEH